MAMPNIPGKDRMYVAFSMPSAALDCALKPSCKACAPRPAAPGALCKACAALFLFVQTCLPGPVSVQVLFLFGPLFRLSDSNEKALCIRMRAVTVHMLCVLSQYPGKTDRFGMAEPARQKKPSCFGLAQMLPGKILMSFADNPRHCGSEIVLRDTLLMQSFFVLTRLGDPCLAALV